MPREVEFRVKSEGFFGYTTRSLMIIYKVKNYFFNLTADGLEAISVLTFMCENGLHF